MMLRQSVGLATRVAGPSRPAVLLARRTLVATPRVYRQQDRRQSEFQALSSQLGRCRLQVYVSGVALIYI